MSTSTFPIARFVDCAGAHGGRRSHCKVQAVADSGSVSWGKKSDYYKVLSLEHSAAVGTVEIKRAFRRLALRYHPDVCPPSRRAESTELFLELRRAYETLTDPARRIRYEAELRTTEKATAADDEFARDVWEAQLCVLRARSEQRRQRARHRTGHRCD
ncbi:hypothetical protein BAE44_0000709 [Dichanthelium oligosanthes]|uniref:J domain-containing protein n=1 Tax=Dichanthelium oligosanthes TaxID=888268 RepID=A0A1E5WLI7_9POAL|nr:hypothetical protein BAE44_0000709 [Dichanthelium oligosanthes]